MGEKGSHKNKLKDFFRILKKKKEKQIKEQETKKKRLKEKNILKKILIIIGYFGNVITYPLTKEYNLKDKKPETNFPSKKNNVSKFEKQFIVNKNEIIFDSKKKKEFKKIYTFQNYNDSNLKQSIHKKETIQKNELIQNNKSKKKKRDLIFTTNHTSIKKINDNTHSEITLKERVIPKVLVAGGLASHTLGSVSKEVIETIQNVMNPVKNNENNLTEQKKELNIDIIKKNNINLRNIENEKANEQVIQNKKHFENQDEIRNPDKEKTEIVVSKKNEQEKFLNEEKMQEKSLKPDMKEKRNDLKPILLSINEIETSTSIIKNDIEKEENEWFYIERSLKLLDENKKKKFIPSIIQRKSFDILSLPIPFLKNSWLSKIVNSIIINHRIKRMKKLINKEYKVEYYNLKKILSNIDNQKDIILKNIRINKNSLEEIENLKEELLKINDNSLEVMKANRYLAQIELDLINQNRKLKEQLEQNKNLEEKGKEKIKTLEKKAR